jgi:hypothetical protein
METQLVERRCDGPNCDSKIIINQAKPNQEELSHWIILVMGTLAPQAQLQRNAAAPVQPKIKHACRKSCAINILNMDDEVPKEESPEGKAAREALAAAANDTAKPKLVEG